MSCEECFMFAIPRFWNIHDNLVLYMLIGQSIQNPETVRDW
jgi:hypothetical protein